MTQHHHTIRAARFARTFMPFVLIAAASVLALTFSSLVPAASLGPCGGDVHVPNQVSLCGTASGKATENAIIVVNRDIFRNGGWSLTAIPSPYDPADARVSFAAVDKAVPAGSTITSAELTWSSDLSTKDAGATFGQNLPGGAGYSYCDWDGGTLASVKNIMSGSYLANHIEVVGRSPTAIPGTTTAFSASPITTAGSFNLLSVYPVSAFASTITLVATVSYDPGRPYFSTEGQGCHTEFDVAGGYGQVNVSAMLRVTYTPPAPTLSISGNAGAGTAVTAGGVTARADAGGDYHIASLFPGAYSVTPINLKTGCTASPPSRVVTLPPNAQRVDFTVSCVPNFAVRPLAGSGVPVEHPDPNLRNARGLAIDPNGYAWVADKGTGLATIYDEQGNPQPLTVSVPSADSKKGGKPTGVAFNAGSNFVVTIDRRSSPADIIFASADGVISAYSLNENMTHAVPAIRMASAVYKGIAVSNTGVARLYAADWHGNKIDVFSAPHFLPMKMPGAFTDPHLPADYSPHNIVAIGGRLLVAYAQRGVNDEVVAAPGSGVIDAYDDNNGQFLQRIATGGTLNAPWAIVMAPKEFYSGGLLVGNAGDGTISAFDPISGAPLGQLRTPSGAAVSIQGLFGLAFGQNSNNQQTLFFAAGDQASGVFGRIDMVPAAAR